MAARYFWSELSKKRTSIFHSFPFDFSLPFHWKTNGDVTNFSWAHCSSQRGSDNNNNVTPRRIKVIPGIQSNFMMLFILREAQTVTHSAHSFPSSEKREVAFCFVLLLIRYFTGSYPEGAKCLLWNWSASL